MRSFTTTVHGKCILVGEHAVLRGHPGIVFPIHCKFLSLYFEHKNNNKKYSIDCDSLYSENLLLIFSNLFDLALNLLGEKQATHGKFFIKNNIPMGFGMGFSSAICAAITSWFLWNEWIKEEDAFLFARSLEDKFHGKSSGIDIAGVLSDCGIFFTKKDGFRKIKLNWKPHLYISSSEFSSSTSHCIDQVEKLRAENKALAESLDMEMAKSVLLAEKALAMDEKQGVHLLAQAINQANVCFQQWGLINEQLFTHMDKLTDRGAIAVKPTGSGAGGYVLSLWLTPPKVDFPFEMIPVFDWDENL